MSFAFANDIFAIWRFGDEIVRKDKAFAFVVFGDCDYLCHGGIFPFEPAFGKYFPGVGKAEYLIQWSTLDRSEAKGFIPLMKAVVLLSFVLAVCAGRALAQQANVSTGTTNAPTHSFETAVSPSLNVDLRNAELQNKRSEVRLGKEFHARGPLIHLFHTRKPGEVPKRFWQLINPFSRSEAQPEPELPRSRDLSPRAWTSVAGWHPGVSSYTYSLTSPEGGQGIGLISIER